MACFYPVTAYRQANGQIKFDDKKGGDPLTLPCKQCIGCRLEHSRQWAMRITHEASTHDENCFITLTYDPEHLPPDGSLRKGDFQKFIRALRKKYVKYEKRVSGYNALKNKFRYKWIPLNPIRFYHCGEYGDKNNRPHYHAILFGFNFDDWIYLFDSPGGEPIYTSPTLEKIWKKGFVTVGTVSFQSAGYVARYCMKKLNGRLKDQVNPKTGLKAYERYNSYTGELTEVLPEYSTMSRRPGIGHNWIANYTRDVYPKDFTTINAIRCRPPEYYDKYLKAIDPDMYDDIKSGRELSAYQTDENTRERLSAREKVKKAQYSQLKRSL